MEDDLGYEPTAQELADNIGMSVKKIKRLQKATNVVLNTGQIPHDPETGQPIFSEPAADDGLSEARDVVVSSLNKRDLAVYNYIMGTGNKPKLSKKDIAKRLGISAAYVSNIAADISQRILQAQKNVI